MTFKKLGFTGLFFGFIQLYSFSASAMMHEGDFFAINHFLKTYFWPLVAENGQGAELSLMSIWSDFDRGIGGAFNRDSALRFNGNQYLITLTGKVAQSPQMTPDGYAIVACHEFGHVLGEGPKQKKPLLAWSSVEGQADYYATNECMWRYVNENPAGDVIHDFDKTVISRCEDSFLSDGKKVMACMRIMSGIIALSHYFNHNKPENEKVSIHRRDESEVEQTLEKYPSNQCRIDTFMAGLFKEERPACWFKD
jgi:hypothetical protein